MKLKYIEFIFENCDSIIIDGKYIGDFLVDDLNTSIHRTACNSIDKMDVARIIAVEIHKDANRERYQFGHLSPSFKQIMFDRFTNWADITEVQFELEEDYIQDGELAKQEYYQFYVDWIGDRDEINDSQKTYISKSGNLYVVIADGKKIEDFYDLDDIEDDEYIDFHFSMCGVGDAYGNTDRYETEDKMAADK